MDTLRDDLLAYWNESVVERAGVFIGRTFVALLALLVLLLVARVSLRAARRALGRTRAHANALLLVDRLVQFTFLLLAAAWVLSIYGVQFTALLAVLGAGALAVSLALQDVLKNLVAGLYILVERPFTIGEQIEFKTYSGTVETIELRTTALRTLAGQRVIIPNAMLFAEALVNRSAYGKQLLRVRVTLPSGDANRQTVDDLLKVIRAIEGESKDVGAAVQVESVTAEKVTLRAELLVPDARKTAPDVAWAIHDHLARAEITVLE
ncbi:MAG TPA: mechanosensitive ion channel domain-containing protein [Chloroflexota bacterium]|nr:mechanosensitive ion channel domain-containing protein [Chloroflexota bacterium]